jgi:hypothetical protein
MNATERFNLNTVESFLKPLNKEGYRYSLTERWIPSGILQNSNKVREMRAKVTAARNAYMKAVGRNAERNVVRQFHANYTTWYNEIMKPKRNKAENLKTLKSLIGTGNKKALNAFIAELNANSGRSANHRAKAAALKTEANAKAAANLAAKKAKAKANLEKLRITKANLESKRNALELQIFKIMNQMRPLLNMANN